VALGVNLEGIFVIGVACVLWVTFRDLEKEFEDLTTSREALGKTVEEKTAIVMSAIAELDLLRDSESADKHLVSEISYLRQTPSE